MVDLHLFAFNCNESFRIVVDKKEKRAKLFCLTLSVASLIMPSVAPSRYQEQILSNSIEFKERPITVQNKRTLLRLYFWHQF